MREHIIDSLEQSNNMLLNIIKSEDSIGKIEKAAKTFIQCLENGGTIFCCGNGGSMSDAMHFAGELSGRYCKSRAPLSAIAISDAIHITCTGNDYGFESIFSRFLQANSRENDCLLAISTSGESNNVRIAAEYAKENEIDVVSLTGVPNSSVGKVSDIDISVTPYGSNNSPDKIQETHIKVIHILVEIIERKFFPEHY